LFPARNEESCFAFFSRRRNEWQKQLGPGSPIGKKGPRKANPKYKRRLGQPWTTQEVNELKTLAKGNTPTGVISLKLERPETAIRSKAQREGISLRPVNRSPYNRKSSGRKR
jgi:hypothetical protein